MKLPEVSLPILHIEEPTLAFNHEQICVHPKDGLFLYGPHLKAKNVREIKIGVIGTPAGIGYFSSWAEHLTKHFDVPPPGKRDKKNRLHLSNFPGIEEAFGITFSPKALVTYPIDLKDIDDATSKLNHHESVRNAVDLYVNKIKKHDENEEQDIDVWVFVLPELVFDRCKPQSRRTGVALQVGEFAKKKVQRSDFPLLEGVIDTSSEEIFDDVPDFHRQVKAALLKLNYTSQLMRETTLAPDQFVNKAGYPIRGVQDPATVGWNLATGLYYKTQPMPPWKLATARSGVAYIGFVYKMIPNDKNHHACCAAQMFLSEGDGVVFRGANGPWQTSKYEFHLGAEAATNLIGKVLETYKGKHKSAPTELFIHGKTTFNDTEWTAFAEAVPKETNLVGVRIKTTDGDTKLFRNGDYPVLRGTALVLDDRNAYLWTNGYLPQLDTYIGPETPNPLLITILRSTGNVPLIADVLRDIMGLTKINYNACNFNDSLPVTVRFADKIGDVLAMGSAKGAEKQPFKFYI